MTFINAPVKMSAMLVVDKLNFIRGSRRLWNGLSFALQRGQILQLEGPNGSGKTTLLKLLCGLLEPDEGSVSWKREPSITYIGHNNGIRLGLTPLENLRLFGASHPEEALNYFNLKSEVLCKSLSAGQKRKVALARLVHSDEPIWILDEPFAGLDKHSTQQLIQLMEQHKKKGNTVIFSTHLPVEMQCERLFLSL